MLLIAVTFIWGISGCSTPSSKQTTCPKPVNSDKNITEGDAASTIYEAANADNPTPSESLAPTGI